MRTLLFTVIICFNALNLSFGQNLNPRNISLQVTLPCDSFGILDLMVFDVRLINNDQLPFRVNGSEREDAFPIIIEYRTKTDSIWHFIPGWLNATVKGFKNKNYTINPGEQLGPFTVKRSPLFSWDNLGNNYIPFFLHPTTIDFRLGAYKAASDTIIYSNVVPLKLHDYKAGTDDHKATQLLLSCKNPGMFFDCIVEHQQSSCFSPDAEEVIILDSISQFYPHSLYAPWANTILANNAVNKLSFYSTRRDAQGRLIPNCDEKCVASDLTILRYIRKHVQMAMSANNDAVNRDLSLSGMTTDLFFESELKLIYSTTGIEKAKIPDEILAEFQINK